MRRLEVTLTSGEVFSTDVSDRVQFTYQNSRISSNISVQDRMDDSSDGTLEEFAESINASLRADQSKFINTIKFIQSDEIILFNQANLKVQSADYRINSVYLPMENTYMNVEQIAFIIDIE